MNCVLMGDPSYGWFWYAGKVISPVFQTREQAFQWKRNEETEHSPLTKAISKLVQD